MVIRELDKHTRRAVYENYMREDFPPAELKPLSSIEKMLEAGGYLCTGLYDEKEEMLAYAFFVVSKMENSLLLDYLAVCSGGRGKGYGGIYIDRMKEYFSEKDGIFIECESIESGGAGEEELRRRRIRFYENSGAVVTDSWSNLFGVEYSILYLPIRRVLKSEQVYQGLETIYGEMFPTRYRDKVQLWRI